MPRAQQSLRAPTAPSKKYFLQLHFGEMFHVVGVVWFLLDMSIFPGRNIPLLSRQEPRWVRGFWVNVELWELKKRDVELGVNTELTP